MTRKQERFVEEYLVDLNATQAAIRAGYSAKNADKIGHELLGKTGVAEAVAVGQAARSVRTQLTADWVLEKLRENVARSMQGIAVVDNLGHPTGEWKYEGNVANKALELIGKHLGMFAERVITERAEDMDTIMARLSRERPAREYDA